MPHSLSPEGIRSPADEDNFLPDAPPANPEASDVEDEGGSGSSTAAVKEPSKADVKLEDLFDDDDDEDEDFPFSGVTEGTAPNSSPPANPP